jgi:hypothetical protein
MTLMALILSGELVLLAVIVSLGLMIANRRRRDRMLQAVGDLLDNFVAGQPEHLAQLKQNLEMRYPISGKKSSERISSKLIAEEREFLRELVKILLTNDLNGLAELHHPLRNLLNRQMELVFEASAATPPAQGVVEEEIAVPGTRKTEPAKPFADDDFGALLDSIAAPEAHQDEADETPDNDEFETLLKGPVLSKVPAQASAEPISDDELEALLKGATLPGTPEQAPTEPISDDEFESLLQDAVLPETPEQAPAEAVSDDEFEGLLQDAALPETPEQESAEPISDDEFEGLLQDAALPETPEQAPAEAVSDDEFEALLKDIALPDAPKPETAAPPEIPEPESAEFNADEETEVLPEDIALPGSSIQEAAVSNVDDDGEPATNDEIEHLLNDIGLPEVPEPDTSQFMSDDEIDALLDGTPLQERPEHEIRKPLADEELESPAKGESIPTPKHPDPETEFDITEEEYEDLVRVAWEAVAETGAERMINNGSFPTTVDRAASLPETTQSTAWDDLPDSVSDESTLPALEEPAPAKPKKRPARRTRKNTT